MTITRMGGELVDMWHNVLVAARTLASSREGHRAGTLAPQCHRLDESHLEDCIRSGAFDP